MRLPDRVRGILGSLLLDRWRGLRTGGQVPTEELGIDGPHRHGYLPIPWRSLGLVLAPRDVSPTDVFLDLGSGMGRAVYLASRKYGFARVIGVELSEQLHRQAERNLRRRPWSRGGSPIELVNADITRYVIPGDVTVIFFFNAVSGPLFDDMLARIFESIDREPRTVRLIYANPEEESRLAARGRARLVLERRGSGTDPSSSRVQLWELR